MSRAQSFGGQEGLPGRVRGMGPWFLLLVACGLPVPPPPEAGKDAALSPSACTVLQQAAHRARACDPALTPLAQALEAPADPKSCRDAIRRLLREAPPTGHRVHSVLELEIHLPSDPLTREEIEAVLSLPLPAELTLVPDLIPRPGLPATAVQADDVPLEVDAHGIHHAYVPPGRHTLKLRHADQEHTYCLSLGPCEARRMTMHGARLAGHERVAEGSCRPSPSGE